MNFFNKVHIIAHIIRWRLTWNNKDLSYHHPEAKGEKFITAREFALMIKDGMTVSTVGMAGNHRCSVFFWAVKERFLQSGFPKNLTWIALGAQGTREKAPGSLDELAIPGIISKIISGHYNTLTGIPRLAEAGQIEMHVIPLGIGAMVLEEQAKGNDYLITETGLNTFVDPQVGTGSYVAGSPQTSSYVERVGDKLKYHLPAIEIGMFVAPYADAEGNIYFTNGCTYTEARETTFATRAKGGKVIVSITSIIPKNEKEIFLKSEYVDYIIVHPFNEQTGMVLQRRYWKMLLKGSNENIDVSVSKLKFMNAFIKVTPTRVPAEEAFARAAAWLFMKLIKKGEHINIGTGLPEEVSRMIYEGGIYKDVTFFTETGVIGGLPAPGSFFGTAINPEDIITSAQMFHRLYENRNLTTVLGMIEADSNGNINVSKRGARPGLYVGLGGFTDITSAARNIIFVGSWMAHAQFSVANGKMSVIKKGEHKFVEKVSEVSYNGSEGLRKEQNVYYVTNVGIFKLTQKGMCLIYVMPGIDIEKDILNDCPMKIVLPEKEKVEVIPLEVFNGKDFRLKWD